jgi:hypothetical protein
VKFAPIQASLISGSGWGQVAGDHLGLALGGEAVHKAVVERAAD